MADELTQPIPEIPLRPFAEIQALRARKHGREVTPFDRAVAGGVIRAAELAMNDVRKDTATSFRVVTAPTGSGKSVSAANVATVLFHTDPTFSCAFVVETIRQVDEIGLLLSEILGQELVTVWSSAHDKSLEGKDQEIERVVAEHGKLQMPRSLKDNLTDERLVVVTHALWKQEVDEQEHGPCRYYRGKRRSLIFVDEHPNLVEAAECTPGDFMKLRDRIADPEHPAYQALETIIWRCEHTLKHSFQGSYAATAIAGSDYAQIFGEPGQPERRAPALGIANPNAQDLTRVDQVCRFIQFAANGFVFLSRRDHTFVASRPIANPGPGHVLLDATADITGMAALAEGMARVNVPQVDFSNLEIVHVHHPEEFKYVSQVVTRARTAKLYADWIKKVVLEHTQPGDDVLVSVHKTLLDENRIPRAEDPAAPLDWDGRKVNTLHWGVGIGSNRYRNKNVVLTFSEHHRPGKAAITDAYAWSGLWCNYKTIKDANVPINPRGVFRTARDGHLLRWNKQLACRGAVRNIDADGTCGKMRWVTTMDQARLVEWIDVLFPGAKLPKFAASTNGKATGVDRLMEMLTSDERDVLWFDVIEEETGIQTKNLATTTKRSKKIQRTMDRIGWKVRSARELGEPGNMKALVREVAGEAIRKFSSRSPRSGSNRTDGSPVKIVRVATQGAKWRSSDGKTGYTSGSSRPQSGTSQTAKKRQKSSRNLRRRD